jgi:DNA-binding SARP family transcriptional activator/predicted ATPase
MEGKLQINLLGSPIITYDGEAIRGFVSTKAVALVYYLAATQRAHTREKLAGLLWGEVSEAQALKNLRDVLSNLRRLLDPFLHIDRRMVELLHDDRCEVDSVRFEQLIKQAQRDLQSLDSFEAQRAAIGLYRGGFLENFFVAQAPDFEEWVVMERERFHQLALFALHNQAEHALSSGRYLEGIDYATRLLTIDPWREETHRQLMLLQLQSGQPRAAIAHYEAYAQTLQQELGVDPVEETQAIYHQICSGVLSPTPIVTPPVERPREPRALPVPLTPMVGRTAERAYLARLLQTFEARFITIVGVGGVGKTRLALDVADHVARADSHQPRLVIAFVSLVGSEAPDGSQLSTQAATTIMSARIAEALAFSFSGVEAPEQQLIDYLREQRLLLVLDNIESLLNTTAFLTALLQAAPQVSILATSRVRLNLRYEHIIQLDGLPLATEDEALTDSVWEQNEALRVFRQTAAALNPHRTFPPPARAAVARICRLVDGLPLAIELAASMTQLLSCQEIAREIDANKSFLQASQRDMPQRHRSLQAVFNASWNLLAPDEQRVLQQLAVFVGGFSREAATTVADASLPVLASLCDQSLVYTIVDDEQMRYALLNVTRQYALERLKQAGDARFASTQNQHCHYFLELLERYTADLRGTRQRDALAALGRELDNVRTAWQWAIETSNLRATKQAAESLFHFYEMRSWFQEGATIFGQMADHFAALMEHAPERAYQVAWGRMRARQGWFTFQIGQTAQARDMLAQSLRLLNELDQPDELLFPLNFLAAVTAYDGHYAEARRLCERSLAISRAHGDRYNEAIACTILGQTAYAEGDYAQARASCRASLAIDRSMGHAWGTAFSLITLGDTALAVGSYPEARRYFQEALAIREATGDVRGSALCLNSLGDVAQAQRDSEGALGLYQTSLARLRAVNNRRGIALTLNRLGYLRLQQQDEGAAASYFAEALSIARGAQILPLTLEALVGLVIVYSQRDPHQSYQLLAWLHHHPNATRIARNYAAQQLAQVGAGGALEVAFDLDDVVAQFDLDL